MTLRHYILDKNNRAVKAELLEWAQWLETADRRVAWHKYEDIIVSTVFLGLDHSFNDEGPPLIFETMVFPDTTTERYSTYEQAVAGHEAMCERVWGSDWRTKANELNKPGS